MAVKRVQLTINQCYWAHSVCLLNACVSGNEARVTFRGLVEQSQREKEKKVHDNIVL